MKNTPAPYKNYKTLYSDYWVENLSMAEIAKKYNIHHGTMKYWFRKLSVPTRNKSEAVKTAYQEGRSKPTERKEKHIVHCAYCGEEILKWRYVIEQHKQQFCNRRCKGKYWRENYKGANAGNWQGGIWASKCEKRQDERYRQVRLQVLERDSNTCQMCGKTDNLVTHHIIPLKQNLDLAYEETNLITLCDECHCNKVNFHEDDYKGIFTDIVKNKRRIAGTP